MGTRSMCILLCMISLSLVSSHCTSGATSKFNWSKFNGTLTTCQFTTYYCDIMACCTVWLQEKEAHSMFSERQNTRPNYHGKEFKRIRCNHRKHKPWGDTGQVSAQVKMFVESWELWIDWPGMFICRDSRIGGRSHCYCIVRFSSF